MEDEIREIIADIQRGAEFWEKSKKNTEDPYSEGYAGGRCDGLREVMMSLNHLLAMEHRCGV